MMTMIIRAGDELFCSCRYILAKMQDGSRVIELIVHYPPTVPSATQTAGPSSGSSKSPSPEYASLLPAA
jgi:hypothetical protein